jgi:hypothetical protein
MTNVSPFELPICPADIPGLPLCQLGDPYTPEVRESTAAMLPEWEGDIDAIL